MDDLKKGANQSNSPGDKGATEATSPTAEHLKSAQDAAEKYRKESESLRERLETRESEFNDLNEKLNLTKTEKDRKNYLQDKIEEDNETLAIMAIEQSKTDRNMKAILAAAQTLARKEIEETRKKEKEEMSKSELEKNYASRDQMLVEEAKKRGIEVEAFKDLIDPYAKFYPKSAFNPVDQLKNALELLKEKESLAKERKEIEEAKKNNNQFRDNGTNHSLSSQQSGDQKSKQDEIIQIGGWEKAKTQAEKEIALTAI